LLPLCLKRGELAAAAVHPSADFPHTTQNRFTLSTLVWRIDIEQYFALKNALTTIELNLGNCVRSVTHRLAATKLSEPETGFKRRLACVPAGFPIITINGGGGGGSVHVAVVCAAALAHTAASFAICRGRSLIRGNHNGGCD
jgi:hypothetical protein